MRRRVGLYIPLLMLAMLVQIFAPIAAFRAVAYAASDPLHAAPICSGAHDRAQGDHGNAVPSDHQCCGVCGTVYGGPLSIDPPATFVLLQRDYQLVAWLEPADFTLTTRPNSHAQARAPPIFS